MSIPKAPRNIINQLNGQFESQEFSIKVTREAFKVLIDRLYTNKERSIIRELWTNAYDSHVEAGKADVPFLVELPTVLNPIFRVRDYGVSMTHETVMHLYSQVFNSTKTHTNELIGQLGLGSKSPFAYTDSFTVIAYLDGQKRTYIVALNSDGIPTVTHISTEDTDEPTGLEVSFPVQFKHADIFAQEAKTVAVGFDVPPVLPDGSTFKTPQPVLALNNWAIYETDYYGGMQASAIRQGCVLYPITNSQIRVNDVTNNNHYMVVTVPIGTCEVAANREALSLDDDTIDAVRNAFSQASKEIMDYLTREVTEAPTFLEASKKFWNIHYGIAHPPSELQWTNSPSGRTLKVDGYIRFGKNNPKDPHLLTKRREPANFTYRSDNLSTCMFVIDRGQQMLRKRMRIKQYMADGRCFLLENPSNKDLERLVRRLGLNKNQIISVTSIPDVEHAPRRKSVSVRMGSDGSSTSLTGVYFGYSSWGERTLERPKMIEEPFYWIPIEKGNPFTHIVFEENEMTLRAAQAHDFALNVIRVYELEERPVYLLTPQARKRLKVTDENNFIEIFRNSTSTVLDKMKVYGKYYAVYSDLSDRTFRMLERHGLLDKDEFNFFQIVYSSHPLIGYLLKNCDGNLYDEGLNEGRALIEQMQETYPLLFPQPSDEAIADYINYRKQVTNQ